MQCAMTVLSIGKKVGAFFFLIYTIILFYLLIDKIKISEKFTILQSRFDK
jgi:hypothetical protein